MDHQAEASGHRVEFDRATKTILLLWVKSDSASASVDPLLLANAAYSTLEKDKNVRLGYKEHCVRPDR